MKIKNMLLSIWDVILFPFVYVSSILFRYIRKKGVERLPVCKKALLHVGVFPIRDHYYEPLFHPKYIKKPLSDNRNLPGIDWNIVKQMEMLADFHFSEELHDIPTSKVDKLTFYINNGSFASGDAEFWYNIIRLKQPRRIIEIGSGNSTLMARKAISKNQKEVLDYNCKHICIEPYEMPWLEKTGAMVIRKTIEDVDKSIFSELNEDDILFIDSSHMIRPQGDVLIEYLELLPILAKGVIVHVHDIFSPKDYGEKLVKGKVRFWNEQYLLEAFLTSNNEWEIIGALNFLHHNHYDKLKGKCPFLTPDREPGSFYMKKIV